MTQAGSKPQSEPNHATESGIPLSQQITRVISPYQSLCCTHTHDDVLESQTEFPKIPQKSLQ